MDSSIPILVTGAAGRLGRYVADVLNAEGISVRATDVVNRSDTPFEFRPVDLLDEDAVGSLLDGIGAVVHLGNHPRLRHPQRTFNENVAMNMNVFQAAAEQGVRKMVFASTLQLIGSHVDRCTVRHPPGAPNYPLSGDTAALPANAYALSKSVSESMLKYFADRCGMNAVAIRFPRIRRSTPPALSRTDPPDEDMVREGFAWISLADASRLILAVLCADLPGFRIYAPGTSGLGRDIPLTTLIRDYHPGAPGTLESLIDQSRITSETGWEPASS